MDWFIHHINTPAVNVKRTAAFLRSIIGMEPGTWTYPPNAGDLHQSEDTIAVFGSDNRGIHVVRPIPTFAQDNGLFHNPTVGGHVAITVSDLDGVKSRLEAAGVVYSDAGSYAMAGAHQIYFYDPSMNVIEINGIIDQLGGAPPRAGEAHDVRVEPGGWYIHHVNIPAFDVPEAVTFYRDVVGLPESTWQFPDDDSRGTFKGDPEHLAVFGADNRGIHIVKPMPDFAKNNGFMHNPTIGGHYAITVPDINEVKARLDAAKHLYTDAGTYAMAGTKQVYVLDPEARFIEINEVVG